MAWSYGSRFPNNMFMPIARTGLQLDANLYHLAQRKAASLQQSFAAYVVDLIAADVMHDAGADQSADVLRLRATMQRISRRYSDGVPLGLVAEQERMAAESSELADKVHRRAK